MFVVRFKPSVFSPKQMTIFANCQNDHLRVWWPRSQAFSVLGCADSHLFSELAKHLDSETRGVAWMVSCLRHLTWDVDPVLLWFFVSWNISERLVIQKKKGQFCTSGSQRFATFKSTFSCGVSMGFGLRARGGVMDSHFFQNALDNEIRDSRSEIRDPRSEIRDPRSKIRDSRSEIRDSRSEIRDPRFEIRDSRSEIRDPRSEIRDSRSEIRDSRFQFRH